VKRLIVAALLSGMLITAASANQDSATEEIQTLERAFSSALRQSIGSPARADLGNQATIRLADGLLIVPKEPAAKLLTVTDQPVPPDFAGLLLGSEGMEARGIIRFVPAGFVDSDAALAWTPDDLLFSLRATVEHENPDRVKASLPEREARRWIEPPHYNPESHQLSWAALILPKNAPRESDGEVTYYGLGFGREGYVQITVVSSVQKADAAEHMVDDFLAGLNFVPGKAYGDAAPGEPRPPGGLANAMGIDRLRKAEASGGFLASDTVVPVAGGIVASIGALSLLLYVQRHLRRESRRG
jgi:uncharacterized membrane-anchored protein